jgi:pyridinium-3,5-biscarboxylic acid mononucleotide synthase
VTRPAGSGPNGSGDLGFADLGFARVDIDRERRQGLPEVVYGPGKTVPEMVEIVWRLMDSNRGPVLVTRVEPQAAAAVSAAVPDARYDEPARVLVWRAAAPGDFGLGIVTAGTTDGPVAREAAAVAEAIGMRVRIIGDVGVAGLHRLLAVADEIATFDAVVVVAGMEAALASVVGGLVACPVIAVPTSTGYGASLDGVTALLGMLSSCAPGITVVNIDSGFGAAMAAHRLARCVVGRS